MYRADQFLLLLTFVSRIFLEKGSTNLHSCVRNEDAWFSVIKSSLIWVLKNKKGLLRTFSRLSPEECVLIHLAVISGPFINTAGCRIPKTAQSSSLSFTILKSEYENMPKSYDLECMTALIYNRCPLNRDLRIRKSWARKSPVQFHVDQVL